MGIRKWIQNWRGRAGKIDRRVGDRRKENLGRTTSHGFLEISARDYAKIKDQPPQYGKDFVKLGEHHKLDKITAKERRRIPQGTADIVFATDRSGEEILPPNRRNSKHLNRK